MTTSLTKDTLPAVFDVMKQLAVSMRKLRGAEDSEAATHAFLSDGGDVQDARDHVRHTVDLGLAGRLHGCVQLLGLVLLTGGVRTGDRRSDPVTGSVGSRAVSAAEAVRLPTKIEELDRRDCVDGNVRRWTPTSGRTAR
jgi:hypothetical protein